jgi:hypothetical protein
VRNLAEACTIARCGCGSCVGGTGEITAFADLWRDDSRRLAEVGQMIAPAEEAAPLDELRVVLGKPAAMKAIGNSRPCRIRTGPFWSSSRISASSRRNSKRRRARPTHDRADHGERLASSCIDGGWGCGRFVEGQPADLAQHQTCFACHSARVKFSVCERSRRWVHGVCAVMCCEPADGSGRRAAARSKIAAARFDMRGSMGQ